MIRHSLICARECKQFGEPRAEKQLNQAMLADSQAEACVARRTIEGITLRKSAGRDVSCDASCCKMFASEVVGLMADSAVRIHASPAYMADYADERFHREVRPFLVHEDSTQNQWLMIARSIIRDAAA